MLDSILGQAIGLGIMRTASDMLNAPFIAIEILCLRIVDHCQLALYKEYYGQQSDASSSQSKSWKRNHEKYLSRTNQSKSQQVQVLQSIPIKYVCSHKWPREIWDQVNNKWFPLLVRFGTVAWLTEVYRRVNVRRHGGPIHNFPRSFLCSVSSRVSLVQLLDILFA